MMLSKTKMITGCCVLLLVGLLVSPATSFSLDITIDISPNVLNIQSQGTVVTVPLAAAEKDNLNVATHIAVKN